MTSLCRLLLGSKQTLSKSIFASFEKNNIVAETPGKQFLLYIIAVSPWLSLKIFRTIIPLPITRSKLKFNWSQLKFTLFPVLGICSSLHHPPKRNRVNKQLHPRPVGRHGHFLVLRAFYFLGKHDHRSPPPSSTGNPVDWLRHRTEFGHGGAYRRVHDFSNWRTERLLQQIQRWDDHVCCQHSGLWCSHVRRHYHFDLFQKRR